MSRILCFTLAAMFLMNTGRPSEAQEKKPELVPPSKTITRTEASLIAEKVFGPDSEELRRPVHVWMPDVGIIVCAKDFSVLSSDSRIRFGTASLAVLPENAAPGTPFEVQRFRSDEITVSADRPVMHFGDLKSRRIVSVEIATKQGKIMLAPVASQPANGDVVFSTAVQTAPSLPAPAFAQSPLPEQKKDAPEPRRPVETRFKFSIDAKSRLIDLLPAPVKAQSLLPAPLNENLAKVPEVSFGEPVAKDLTKLKAMEATAHILAKINHLNFKKSDGFMDALLAQRSDLHGLPVLMGEECRMREEQAKIFAEVATHLSQSLSQAKAKVKDVTGEAAEEFWSGMAELNRFVNVNGAGRNTKGSLPRASQEYVNRAAVAALTQILMPESEHLRVGLAKFLATIPHADATKALARLSLYSAEDDVRAAAIEGLKLRRERDYTDILMQGFRYPLPAVSKRAAEALVKLERKDLIPKLVGELEQADPRMPAKQKVDGKEVTTVRELVKVNHHRNCALCHAPGNTENTPEGVLKVAVPLPTEPLPKPSEGGYQSTPPPSQDIVVRIDMTYLRQDFSLMMPVKDAHPWPEMQRFDFLVRTRALTPQEAEAYDACCEMPEPGRLSPYHRAALFALRELTGRDTEPTAAAWRKLLNLPASK
jgi:hypothetical protein